MTQIRLKLMKYLLVINITMGFLSCRSNNIFGDKEQQMINSTYKYKRYRKAETVRQLKQFDAKHLNYLDYHGFKIYILSDERVLKVIVGEGSSTEYGNLDLFINHREKKLAEAKEYYDNLKQGRVKHMLNVYSLPFEEHFSAHVGSLIERLQDSLSIDHLDGSLESLILIDKKFKQQKLDGHEVLDKYFPMLVAYNCVVLMKETNGTLEMRHIANAAPSVWEPYVVGSDGKEYSPYSYMVKQLYENNKKYSLHNVVINELNAYMFIKE